MEEPVRQIAENAGVDGSMVAQKVMQCPKGVGFNVMTSEYEDMLDAGIVDTTMVTRIALMNAASAASVLLTMEAGVVDTTSNLHEDDDLKGGK